MGTSLAIRTMGPDAEYLKWSSWFDLALDSADADEKDRLIRKGRYDFVSPHISRRFEPAALSLSPVTKGECMTKCATPACVSTTNDFFSRVGTIGQMAQLLHLLALGSQYPSEQKRKDSGLIVALGSKVQIQKGVWHVPCLGFLKGKRCLGVIQRQHLWGPRDPNPTPRFLVISR